MRKAALRSEAAVALGLRDIGDDILLLAALQRRAVVISRIRDRLQRLHFECFLRRCGHLIQLVRVVAVVDHLAGDNQRVLVVNRNLNVVAGDPLAALAQ
jgi:hypothetical protein